MNWNAKVNPYYRIIVNEGGTGSGKTYALCQLFALILHTERGRRLTVCRKTLPALRATAMRDFFEILKAWDLYEEKNHNKTALTYFCEATGSEIEFISIDQPTKVRSRKRDYLWVNEATELSYEDFEQLNMRTYRKVFMDYNPSYTNHWIYDLISRRWDVKVIKSTYKDNPFLPAEVVREIERYKEVDDVLWTVYGLGERASAKDLVYSNYIIIDDFPAVHGVRCYGLDFGYVNPCAIVEAMIWEGNLYLKEVLYQSYLTNSEIISFLKERLNRNLVIYADPSQPAFIDEIRRAGFLIQKADNKVREGIDLVRRFKIHIVKGSENLIKEINSYSWKKNARGEMLEEPVKLNDHLMDAVRYAVNGMKTKIGKSIITTAKKVFLSDIIR